jgi:hypothetical protein
MAMQAAYCILHCAKARDRVRGGRSVQRGVAPASGTPASANPFDIDDRCSFEQANEGIGYAARDPVIVRHDDTL